MDLTGRRILVVDEDPIGRRPVVRALGEWGADVVEAATVAQAERVDGRIDAAILSLPLSASRWSSLFARVRSRWPGVWLMGSTVMPLERIPATHQEQAVLVSKPISLRDLRAHLRSQLRKLA